MTPVTKFTRAGDVSIAYQTYGSGERDLIVVPGWISNIELFWEEPRVSRFFGDLGRFSRVILFDKRGTGLSDRNTESATLEERMDDVRAVMDAVGSERAALLGYSEGGPMCCLFAVTYPERTDALILVGSYATLKPKPDHPWGRSEETQQSMQEGVVNDWGAPIGLEMRAPSVADDPQFQRWWSRYMRMSASPASAWALNSMNYQIDVRQLLSSIRVPTLVIHATGDRTIPIECGRYLAQHIPDAHLVELNTADHLPYVGCPEEIANQADEFLTGRRTPGTIDRVVKTVMFTDIVDSTALASELGDTRWVGLLEDHHATVRRELSVFRGQEIKTTGDGFHAAFDGPARAIQCACAVRDAVQTLGVSIRVGLHTGECELVGSEVEGLAVHIAARVAATAAAGEVLVSRTVKDLVAGSGVRFADRGEHVLKGIPDQWQLFSVVD
jgi:pimeloyl-ACP methyl ester carboxylesterase